MKLDIDYLKNCAASDPYYHGLGSIRLQILPFGPKKFETINFYSKKYISAISKWIHTHPANLYCTKLYGSYENIKYDWKVSEEKTDLCMEELQCEPNTPPKLLHSNVSVSVKDTELLNDSIVHSDTQFHDVNPITDVVITKMTHHGFTGPKVRVIRNKNEDYVCGLGQRGDPKDNWEIIRQILNEI